jgi:hypothetical protein
VLENLSESLPRKDQVAVSSKEPTFLNDSRQSAAQKLKGMSESFDVLNTFERRGCKTGLCPLQLHVLFMLVGQHCFFTKAISSS